GDGNGYKVRLADGSEIGPMNLQAVKDWYIQGLIGRDSLVLEPGKKSWQPLTKVINLKEVRVEPARSAPERHAPAAAAARRRPPASRAAVAEAAEEEAPEPVEVSTWRTRLAGVLFLASAVGAGYFYLRPDRWLPALDAAPWREIGLAQIVLGL